MNVDERVILGEYRSFFPFYDWKERCVTQLNETVVLTKTVALELLCPSGLVSNTFPPGRSTNLAIFYDVPVRMHVFVITSPFLGQMTPPPPKKKIINDKIN